MAFQLSPGVNVSEIDLTTIVPAVGTTEGAFVGIFDWGPANEIVSISNELELVDRFGIPSANTYESFFTAANFLSYARNLRLIRAVSNTSYNATGNDNISIQIANRDAYDNAYFNITTNNNSLGTYVAKYPGELGNTLKVAVCAANAGSNSGYSTWKYNNYFDSFPNTSSYVAGVKGSYDEIHIAVIDEDGKISGTANTVLERFGYVSKAIDARNSDGSSNYYVNVLLDRSKYIYAVNHANASNWGTTASNTVFDIGSYSNGIAEISLDGGSSNTVSVATVITSYDKFKNADEVDISLVMVGPHSGNVAQHVIDNIAEYRKDCVAFVSPGKSDVVYKSGSEVTNIQNFRNTTLNRSSSYAFMDTGWKYQFDKYNNVYRWVPLNGDMAGLCVRTDFERDPWYSPAGFNRGQIRNVTKLSWNPNKSQRDDLYKIGVNPVVSFPGEGTILYGDKTLQSKPSAFDRINVRRLFIVLEKAIARAAKYSLFEFNDEFTRSQFVALTEPYLRDVQGRRGIYDFRVVCDTTNNTPEVIDRNEFVGDIYIKPARSINFIQLNFIAVRTGVAFEEIVGRF